MTFHSCFYRSLIYLHAIIAVAESAVILTLFFLIITTHRDLFFKINDSDEENVEGSDVTNGIIVFCLFFVGAIRTVVLFIFEFMFFSVMCNCCCLLCVNSCRQKLFRFFKSRATHRFFSFNCNCPCYRARPKLRFQLQFMFLMLVSCIRITTIIFCFSVRSDPTIKSFGVIVTITFVFLVLTSLLDYYHYRVWWKYKPNFVKLSPDFKMPIEPLSSKHKRFLPYRILGSHRTGEHGDKLCANQPCTNRKLEHILIFHMDDHQPQPRWSKLQELNPDADTYIGFHRTTAESALLIAHSAFRRSTKPPQMLGFGIYFARSIKNTIGKARFDGAIFVAEIRMGKVKEVTSKEIPTVRNSDHWHPEYDTVYYNQDNEARDEFCIYDETQILKWIIVVDEVFDSKTKDYAMDQEYNDTKCFCI